GSPGLSNLTINVNGVRFKVTGLKDGVEQTVDISSAMHAGDNNVVNLEGRGKKGSWAEVIIWDGGGSQ
ncbi:MAG TPA: hypothetical protein VLT87_30865, partial [Thermoanaerobaculia bacterium]|nr:hypothetical protein [Thermoanaerobaculia bacterium]